MTQDGQSERIHAPTARRLDEARRRGQAPRSAVLTGSLSALAVLAVLAVMGPGLLSIAGEMFAQMLCGAARKGVPTMGETLVAAGPLAIRLAVLMATALAVAVAANLLQTGLLWAGEVLRPSWDRLSPAGGWRRMHSARAFAGGMTALINLLAVGGVLAASAADLRSALAGLTTGEPAQMMEAAWRLGLSVMARAAAVLAAVGALDYLVRRWLLHRDLRMSTREIRDELRQTEGARHTLRRRART